MTRRTSIAVSPWFRVTEAVVESGHESSTWHFQEHPGAAVAVPITPEGRVLVSSEYRPSVDSVLLEVPGGRIDPGEAPETAAVREMFEEIGAVAERTVFLGSFMNSPGSSDELTHAFAAVHTRVVEPRPGTVETSAEELLDAVVRSTPTDLCTVATVLLARAAGVLR